jgi:integrase
MCKHLQLKGNTYYYRRRIPEDVRRLHKKLSGKAEEQLFFSLKTTDKIEACRRADAHTRRLDALWKGHREGNKTAVDPHVALATLEAARMSPGDAIRYPDSPAISDFMDILVGQHEAHEPQPRISPQDKLTLDILHGAPVPKLLSDARDKHFELGKGPKGKVAEAQFERAWNLLMRVAGDIPLDHLRREHGNEFVRSLVEDQGVGAETVKKYLAQVRPVISTGLLEFEIRKSHPFEKLVIPNRDEGQRKPRDTFEIEELLSIQVACRAKDDERRWLIAMLSDTMARLSELLAMRKEDVKLAGAVPHVLIRPNHIRRVKNQQSVRVVPLVGAALWAAQQAVHTEGELLFPSLIKKTPKEDFSSAAASAALNKWLKENGLAKQGQTLHGFRHTMRDRLRNVEAPRELIDQIGGWKRAGIGEQYGKGHGLELMHRYMLKTVLRLPGEGPIEHSSAA